VSLRGPGNLGSHPDRGGMFRGSRGGGGGIPIKMCDARDVARGTPPHREVTHAPVGGRPPRPSRAINPQFLPRGVATFYYRHRLVHYINLATARSAERSKEVGVRKSSAPPNQLGDNSSFNPPDQYHALVLAVALMFLLQPLFNSRLAIICLFFSSSENPGGI